MNASEIEFAFLEDETGLKVCGEAVDGYDATEKAERLKARPYNP